MPRHSSIDLRLPRDLVAKATAGQRDTRGARVLRWLLSALFLTVVLGYLLWEKVELRALAREIASADPFWLLAAAVLIVFNRVVLAAKWWLILRGEGLGIALRYLILVTFIGYFIGRLVPGSIGMEAVRVWYLARDHGLGTLGLASVVIDRASGLAATALVALCALLLLPVVFPAHDAILAAAFAVLAAFVLLCVFAPQAARRLGTRGPVIPGRSRLDRLRAQAVQLMLALSTMHSRPWVMLGATMTGVAAQLLRGLCIYLVFVSLGQPGLLAESLALAPILMFLTMLPLGVSSVAIGAAAMVLLLEPAGVPPAVSLSASLISDALVLILIPLGALCFAARGWRRSPK